MQLLLLGTSVGPVLGSKKRKLILLIDSLSLLSRCLFAVALDLSPDRALLFFSLSIYFLLVLFQTEPSCCTMEKEENLLLHSSRLCVSVCLHCFPSFLSEDDHHHRPPRRSCVRLLRNGDHFGQCVGKLACVHLACLLLPHSELIDIDANEDGAGGSRFAISHSYQCSVCAYENGKNCNCHQDRDGEIFRAAAAAFCFLFFCCPFSSNCFHLPVCVCGGGVPAAN